MRKIALSRRSGGTRCSLYGVFIVGIPGDRSQHSCVSETAFATIPGTRGPLDASLPRDCRWIHLCSVSLRRAHRRMVIVTGDDPGISPSFQRFSVVMEGEGRMTPQEAAVMVCAAIAVYAAIRVALEPDTLRSRLLNVLSFAITGVIALVLPHPLVSSPLLHILSVQRSSRMPLQAPMQEGSIAVKERAQSVWRPDRHRDDTHD